MGVLMGEMETRQGSVTCRGYIIDKWQTWNINSGGINARKPVDSVMILLLCHIRLSETLAEPR